MSELQPRLPLCAILADAREAARASESGQVSLVAAAIGVAVDEVERRLDAVAERIEVRVTRSMAVGRYLLDELRRRLIPTIRTVFETNRQDYTDEPAQIAAVIDLRKAAEENIFGAGELPEDDRPRYGFAFMEGTPTEPFPFGPVRFVMNLASDELRERMTFTPVDSSTPGLRPDEVGTLDHPLNALARSSDALAVAGLLSPRNPIKAGCGVWENGVSGGVPEAQIWGPLEVTPEYIRVIVIQREAAVAFPEEFEALREVVERQGIDLMLEND
jgi:hypothetical protein